MADLKISQLSASSALAGTEVTPIVQGAATKKATIDQILSPAAGKGVNFVANTPAAGMTSQLLNWYEEGTWTPTVTAFSGTITTVGTVSGTYTRIGRVVTLNYSVAITNNGTGTVAVVLSSVPFTPAKNSFGMGKETQATGNANICFVNAGAAQVLIQTFTSTYPANNNATLEGQITFTV